MPSSALFDRPRPAALGAALAVLAWAVAPPVAADDYMDAIKGEAHKIDAGPAAPAAPAAGAPVAQDPKVAAFEREMEQRFRGTYLFYKQLPTRSREEIFKAYDSGTPIDEIRKMVMDRFQHSR